MDNSYELCIVVVRPLLQLRQLNRVIQKTVTVKYDILLGFSGTYTECVYPILRKQNCTIHAAKSQNKHKKCNEPVRDNNQ